MRALSHLGTRTAVWCKDDSGYGAGGWGGNKVRKLEWLLPDVRDRGRRTILTVGGLGTNWGLATALYAREIGIHTVLGLVDQPVDDHVRRQLRRLRSSGATVYSAHTTARLRALTPWLSLRHADRTGLPVYLPFGGSSPLGAVGYVEASFEIAAQIEAGAMPEPTHIVAAVGSGGTVSGLALGLRLAGLRTRVVGIVVNDALNLEPASIVRLAGKTERLLHDRGADFAPVGLRPADVTMERRWLGPGYGFETPDALAAQRLAEDAEQLRLETVYTAKALAALLALDAAGRFGAGPVLFLNTYGPRGDAA